MKQFGSVPKGALLFILEAVGPKTPAKFRNDGIGDVTHMGIVTGRGDGAIHSSQSRGGVVTSKFKGKTIQNGGWNRVGLLEEFEYGVESRCGTVGIVTAETGRTVNLRKKKGGKLIERIPIGTEVEILDYGPEWCRVKAGRYTGWMMTEFIRGLSECPIAPFGENANKENNNKDELGDDCCCCDHCGVCLSGGLLQQQKAGGTGGLPAGEAGGEGREA